MMKFYQVGDDILFAENTIENLKEIVPNTEDAALEKHVPVITINPDSVDVAVGSVPHPTLPEHYIEWILLETASGWQFKRLQPGKPAQARFLVDEPVLAAYEYCNIHGLWRADAPQK